MSRDRTRRQILSVITHVFLILCCIMTVYPILQIVTVSLRPSDQLYSTSLALIPKHATIKAYYRILFEKDFLIWMRNSFLIAITVTLFGVTLASTTAYAFSRYRFPGWRAGLYAFLLTQLFPATMLMLPLYVLMKAFHLLDTFTGLVVAYTATALPFCVWTLRGYYDTIPVELEQAALIDGCTPWQAFKLVALPEASRGVLAAATLTWARAFGEFGPVLVFAGVTPNKTEVLPTTIYLELSVGNLETAMAVSLLMVAVSFAVLLTLRRLAPETPA